jgi:hypothetical protein
VLWGGECCGGPNRAFLVAFAEDRVRPWLARNVSNDFNGAKVGNRLWLSGNDAFYYCILRELIAFGVPVRTAMYSAEPIANAATYAPPVEEYLLVRTRGGTTDIEVSDSPNISERPTLVIPLRKMWERLLDRAAEINATDVS